jgi:2'-5' RNA ligase
MQEKELGLAALFDKKTQNILAGYYGTLRQNGFIGNQTKDAPYHFTLKNGIGSEKQLISNIERICSETDCFDINLAYVGLFGLKVLFIAPNMNFELLKLQQNFFPDCGNGYHAWAAHATLLIDEPEIILKALPIVVEIFTPFNAKIESVVLYEYFPVRLIKEYRFNRPE